MKRTFCAALMAVTLAATPSFAAKLYLRDGGCINAKRVWRADNRVYVLATRDTLTSFEKSEVNMKRTFPRHHMVAKKLAAVTSQATTAAPVGAAATKKPADSKSGITLPNLSMPKLPERTPDSLVPSSGGGGSIRQNRKSMEEKAGE
jgi:hypothetical protein